MAAVAVKYPAFRELGAEVLAVSVDSVDTHRKWQEEELVRMVKGGALFPLCSDPQGEIGKLFGVYDPGPEEDLRATFIIDPEGRIQALEILAGPAGRNIPETLRILRALAHHRSTGNLLPCGWQPGKPVLAPEPGDRHKPAPTWEIWETRNAF